MRKSGAMATCSVVKFEDDGEWETAAFIEVGGKECKEDRRILKRSKSAFNVAIEADIIEHTFASIFVLRFEIMTKPHDPLVGEVLVAPGIGSPHFDVLDNLTRQDSMRFYFGDGSYRILFSQDVSLSEKVRTGLQEVLNSTVRSDALIRLTGKYDVNRAMSEIVQYYAYR
ncbi:MAG: hypothetical protein OXE41_03450 [Gammaproteobacteria bacterium]|nr:hypothetical protein [Gammaproteobacteria bacterium]MCY4218166.1 hypothetical protein [Gammaproteobacteria bacterium]MCY4274442.1 hypothetical protein [Gammaproteobacteria bacterium]